MPLMLASVRDAEEAALVVELGADIVDAKDPAAGALGALPPSTIAAVVAAVRGRVPVSATIGDLPADPAVVAPGIAIAAAAGADLVKIGLFPDGNRAGLIEALAPLARRTRLVGLLLADRDPDLALVPLLARAGFAGVMIDTADKGAGSLLAAAEDGFLQKLVAAAHHAGLFAGLAGSLTTADLPRLLAFGADVLGFRRALTSGERDGPLSARAIVRLRSGIAQAPRDVVLRPLRPAA